MFLHSYIEFLILLVKKKLFEWIRENTLSQNLKTVNDYYYDNLHVKGTKKSRKIAKFLRWRNVGKKKNDSLKIKVIAGELWLCTETQWTGKDNSVQSGWAIKCIVHASQSLAYSSVVWLAADK